MHKRLFCAASLAAALLLSGCNPTYNWRDYGSADAPYRIRESYEFQARVYAVVSDYYFRPPARATIATGNRYLSLILNEHPVIAS